MGQLDTIKRKREIEAPITSSLSDKTLQEVEKAKRILASLKERQTSGPMRDQTS